MSEPQRWSRMFTKQEICIAMRSQEDGEYVRYEDYAKLRMERIHDLNQIGGLQEENARLKAEVERLKGIILAQSSDFVRSKTADESIKPDGHNDLAGRAVERCLELQAEVERLRKAGDWMCGLLRFDFVTKEWNAAKEGKQS